MKRRELSSRSSKLSPAQQALLEKRIRGASLGVNGNIQASPIERVPRDRAMPLTFFLESLLDQKWSSWEIRENSHRRCFRLTGAFKEEAMERTVNELARRHEALRTMMPLVNGRPAQVIAPSVNLKMPLVDLEAIPEAERMEELLRILAGEVRRPYDLSREMLWRVLLIRLCESEHVLMFSMSHLISDSWSMELLIKDSWTLYQAFSTGQPSPLPELPIQFADYAYWQRETLQGQVLEDLVSYWQRQLDGLKLIPEIHLPIERPLPAVAGERHIMAQHLELPAGLLSSLRELSQREGGTIFMVLVAALIALLHRYTGKDDFGIPSTTSNRYRPETRGVIGCFADFLVLRVRMSGAETFLALLQLVRNVVLEAYEHQDLPFAKFYGHSPRMWNDAETYPSVRINITMGAEKHEGAPESHARARTPVLVIDPVKLPESRVRNAALPGITLIVQENDNRLDVIINYDRERYADEAIKELLENYCGILESVAANPDQRLSELPLNIKTVEP
jgi:hypothetical protein